MKQPATTDEFLVDAREIGSLDPFEQTWVDQTLPRREDGLYQSRELISLKDGKHASLIASLGAVERLLFLTKDTLETTIVQRREKLYNRKTDDEATIIPDEEIKVRLQFLKDTPLTTLTDEQKTTIRQALVT